MTADTAVESLARLAAERVDHRFKGLPPDADGLTVGELAAQRRNLFTGGFATPVLALSAERLEHNLKLMETYAARHGLAFAPHGKTSMAPQLFQRQIEHGAWGITLAVPHQVRVARAFGTRRDLPRERAGRRGGPALDRRRAGRRPGLPLRLLRRLRARRGADGRRAATRGRPAPWTSSSSSPPARAPVPASVRRRSARRSRTRWRPPGRCGWSASRATRARCRRPTRSGCTAWLRRLVALAADFDKAGRFAGRGGDRRQRGRQRLVRRGRRRLRRRSPNSPCPY